MHRSAVSPQSTLPAILSISRFPCISSLLTSLQFKQMDLLLPLPHIFIPLSLASYVRVPASQFDSWSRYDLLLSEHPAKGSTIQPRCLVCHILPPVYTTFHVTGYVLWKVLTFFCATSFTKFNRITPSLQRHIYSSMNFSSRTSCLEHTLLLTEQ